LFLLREIGLPLEVHGPCTMPNACWPSMMSLGHGGPEPSSCG
jgi:hypothetical protein